MVPIDLRVISLRAPTGYYYGWHEQCGSERETVPYQCKMEENHVLDTKDFGVVQVACNVWFIRTRCLLTQTGFKSTITISFPFITLTQLVTLTLTIVGCYQVPIWEGFTQVRGLT